MATKKEKDAMQAAEGDGSVADLFAEATDKGFFGPGTEGKDRERFTVQGAAGNTDVNTDSRAAANGGRDQGAAVNEPVTDPNAGAPQE